MGLSEDSVLLNPSKSTVYRHVPCSNSQLLWCTEGRAKLPHGIGPLGVIGMPEEMSPNRTRLSQPSTDLGI